MGYKGAIRGPESASKPRYEAAIYLGTRGRVNCPENASKKLCSD